MKEQQKQIEEQRVQIEMLKAAICGKNPASGVCGKPGKTTEVAGNVKTN